MRHTRAEALSLLTEYVQNPNLQKHMFAVEAAMRVYAQKYTEDADWWGMVGLLHDFDYERYPSLKDHPFRGSEILREKGFDEDFIETILAHAAHTGKPRDTKAKKAIFAVDELCGLIVAVALVRPNKQLSEVTVESVIKKINQPAFARQVNREEIRQGAIELEITLEEHVTTVLTALQGIHASLGL